MKLNVLNLLSQSDKTLLTNRQVKIKALHLLGQLIKEASDALNLFLNKEFSVFDPHVGETSCQVRAYRVLLLHSKVSKEQTKFKEEIKIFKQLYLSISQQLVKIRTNSSIQNSSDYIAFGRTQLLIDFLKERNLLINISEETYFLTLSYFLTKFKMLTESGDTYIDHEKICQSLNIQKKLSKKIVHSYQLKLAEDSVKFIYDLTNEISSFNGFFKSILHALDYMDDDNRRVLPCYLVMKVLLTHMLNSRIPILLIMEILVGNRISALIPFQFLPNKEKEKFKLSEIRSSDILSFIVHGVSVQADKNVLLLDFTKIDLENIILSNMACHPQYSGKKLSGESQNPFKKLIEDKIFIESISESTFIKKLEMELYKMKAMAKEIGCCESVPSLFFVKHIYCDTIKNQLKKIKIESKIYSDYLFSQSV